MKFHLENVVTMCQNIIHKIEHFLVWLLPTVARLVASYIVWLFPTNDKIWIFTSHGADSFAENAKYQYLYSSHQDNIRAIWISKDDEIVSMLSKEGYEAYAYNSIKGKFLALRSGYMFFTHSASIFMPYSGNSVIVQLWHGNMLKCMGNDKKYKYGILQRTYYKLFGRRWDYFLVTSSAVPSKNAKTAYGLNNGDLLVGGYPRTDILFHDIPDAMIGIDNSVKETFHQLSDNGPLFCYVPTWNGGRNEKTRFSDDKLDLDEVENKLDELNASLIIKQHPYTNSLVDDSQYDNIVTIKESVDMYPLLKYIDTLITDYSSIYFDYLLLDRPVSFFPYDYKEYTNKRGLYFPYEDITPGPKAYKNEKFTSLITMHIDNHDDYAERRRSIRNEFFEFQDGNSCERIHNFIKNL